MDCPALLLLACAHFVNDKFIESKPARVDPNMNISKVDDSTFDNEIERIEESAAGTGNLKPHAIATDEFDHFYSEIKRALLLHGSFTDGGLEDADYASSRYVDPSNVIVVTSSILVGQHVLKSVLNALQNLGPGNAVVLDSATSRIAVFSDGRILIAE